MTKTAVSAAARALSRHSSTRCRTTSAQSFLRLISSTTSASSASVTRNSLPDFLIPRLATYQTASFATSARTWQGTVTTLGNARPVDPNPLTNGNAAQTNSSPATRAIKNPQVDEDGNEMTIEITERASKRLNQIMTKDQNPNLALRIQVESGGCHGFQYLMSLTTLPSEGQEPVAVQAGKAQEEPVSDEDTIFESNGAKVVMDAPSLDLLKGSKVDFTQELIGSQFKIVDNPLATSSCGCGTSFDIKL